MTKTLSIIAFILSCMLTVSAKTFEIKMLNSPSITIDGKELHVGSRFLENAKISWESSDQAMKVLSDDNRVYVVSPKLFSKYHVTCFSDFLSSVKSATVRNDGENFPMTTEDHKAIFEGNFVLMDSVSFKTGWKVDDKSFFEAETNDLDNHNMSFKIPTDNGKLYISRSLLDSCQIDDCIVRLTVRYVELEYNESTLITDSLELEMVPIAIK